MTPSVTTPTVLYILLAVIVVVVAGILIGRTLMVRRARADALRLQKVHVVDQECASAGHAYGRFETGWRCGRCGNHVSRRDGEVYGLVEDGRLERRRERREAPPT